MLARCENARKSQFQPWVKSFQRYVNTTALMLSCQLVLVHSSTHSTPWNNNCQFLSPVLTEPLNSKRQHGARRPRSSMSEICFLNSAPIATPKKPSQSLTLQRGQRNGMDQSHVTPSINRAILFPSRCQYHCSFKAQFLPGLSRSRIHVQRSVLSTKSSNVDQALTEDAEQQIDTCVKGLEGALAARLDVRKIRAASIEAMEAAGVDADEGGSATDILLETVTNMTRSQLRVAQRALTEEEAALLLSFVKRRCRREPVQYIVGEWPFHNLPAITVRAPTLIPRPETEELVHVILQRNAGSGAISLALLRAWPHASALAVDLCAHAVVQADVAEWARAWGADDEEEEGGEELRGKFDCLVSNPPYIPTGDMATLDPEVAQFEDNVALDGGTDGLDVVRAILRAAPAVVKPGGSIWLEVDESHPAKIERWFRGKEKEGREERGEESAREEFRGVEFVEGLDDMFGRPRFVVLRVKA